MLEEVSCGCPWRERRNYYVGDDFRCSLITFIIVRIYTSHILYLNRKQKGVVSLHIVFTKEEEQEQQEDSLISKRRSILVAIT